MYHLKLLLRNLAVLQLKPVVNIIDRGSSAEQKAKLYSGMYANILVPIETSQSAVQQHNLLIPSQTVIDKDGLTGVYVVSSSETALLRWVRLGQTVGDQTEVLSGLKKDDRVILPEGKRLENGMKVQTRNKNRT
jgi:hypothetical protein